ncbi:hypothetical protein ACS0TY_035123 [Phlomoides rotata]
MQRLLIVPPELAYGSKGVHEIPPNATIEMDVELISIKQNHSGMSPKRQGVNNIISDLIFFFK